MPIHLRAEPGDYAEACLLPGDPSRASWIAETLPRGAPPGQRRARAARIHRDVRGHAGLRAVDRDGLPVGGDRRRGADPARREAHRCASAPAGRSAPTCALGDLILASRPSPSDGTSSPTPAGEPHARRRTGSSLHAAVHAAKEIGRSASRRPDRFHRRTFYEPDPDRAPLVRRAACSPSRWRRPSLFTIAALRGVQAACLLTVSDIIVAGDVVRISDAELRRPSSAMAELALACRRLSKALSGRGDAYVPRQPGVGQRTDRTEVAGWPARRRARARAATPLFTERAGTVTELALEPRREGRDLIVAVGGDGTVNEVVNGLALRVARAAPSSRILPLGTGTDFVRTYGIPNARSEALEVLRAGQARTIDLGRATFRAAWARASPGSQHRSLRDDRRRCPARRPHLEAPRRDSLVPVCDRRHVRGWKRAVPRRGRRRAAAQGARSTTCICANGRYVRGRDEDRPAGGAGRRAASTCSCRATSGKLDLALNLPTALPRHAPRPPQGSCCAARHVRLPSAGAPLPVELDGEQPGTTPATSRSCRGPCACASRGSA